MGCCSTTGTARYFTRSARRSERLFRRKGLDAQQKILMRGLRSLGVEGKSVLEIGCGVGGLHLGLLAAGASRATGVDLAPGMIAKAEENAATLGMEPRTEYRCGDFVEMAGELPRADIVLMDKVVCCDSRPEVLLERALDRTIGLFGISYPRNSLPARAFFGSLSFLGERLRWSFHPYFHDPAMVRRTIRAAGMRGVMSEETPVWAVELFAR